MCCLQHYMPEVFSLDTLSQPCTETKGKVEGNQPFCIQRGVKQGDAPDIVQCGFGKNHFIVMEPKQKIQPVWQIAGITGHHWRDGGSVPYGWCQGIVKTAFHRGVILDRKPLTLGNLNAGNSTC